MEVRSAAEFVYRELELRRGVAKVTANGAISAVLVRDFGQGGGDPGEKVFHIDAKRHWRNNRSQLLGSKRRFRVTMLRDNLVGLIEPILSSAGADPLALCTARKKPSDDRPPCLENPRPKGAESTLTENAASPFHAEPKHGRKHQGGFCCLQYSQRLMRRSLVLLGLVVAARAQTAVVPNKTCAELVDLANLTARNDNKGAVAELKISLDTPVGELLGLIEAVQGCEATVHVDEQQQLREFRERLDVKYLTRLRAFLREGMKNGKSFMDMYLNEFGMPTSEDQDRAHMETFLRNKNLMGEFKSFDERYYTKRQKTK
jgi:hypothetical protein